MNRVGVAGGVLTVAGVVGYMAGTVAAYPARAFSVTSVMLGLTLLAIARTDDEVGA